VENNNINDEKILESNDELVRLRKRITFSKTKVKNKYPDLLNIQLNAYEDFLQEEIPTQNRVNKGLQLAFRNNFPIEDASSIYQLEFLDYSLEKPKYTETECRERELTYSKPLKARLLLSSKADKDSEDYQDSDEQIVYLGNIPAMTPRGTFIINGAERVIVTQLHRSPGVFFDDTLHPNGTRIYTARIIPFRGSWVEFITDIHDVIYAYIDRKKKFPVTTLLRALGFSSDEQIMNLFELSEDVEKDQLNEELLGRRIASDIVDLQTGEIIATRDMIMTEELLSLLQNTEISPLKVFNYKDASDEPLIAKTLTKDLTRNQEDALEAIYKQLRSTDAPDLETAKALIDKLFFNPKRYDLGIVGRFRINQKLKLNIDSDTTTLTIEDFVAILKHLIKLHEQKQSGDDIDHLGNRRVRTVGEQLTAQFNVGLARMARTIREKLGIHENEKYRPSDLVNARTITSVVNQFFGTNQLSQFMDQTNPLAELTHKRRTSALGPGGLTRERAGFEVRDVHYTHYGRLCPIETPEGPNIGLISSLAIHARINDLGFIETPYRRVVDGFVTDEIVYLTAEKEDLYNMIPASTEIDDKGKILGEKVKARSMGDFPVLPPNEIHFMDISTDHITSAATSLIPFLEHDDANRALMGSNMQRQAVPLLRPKAPIVGTGMEAKIAKDSRTLLLAEGDGVVEYVCSEYIRIRYDKTEDEEHEMLNFDSKKVINYPLLKFFRTNQDTCINQKPIFRAGDRVIKGMPIADGSSTDKGELALGQNVLVAFMPWRGYNFEDAIIISERLVAYDYFTSIHVEEFTLQVRDTKRGEEEFTREIPNVSDEATKELDENGVIRVGAKVSEGDILIGKITPKGETDPTPEEKLLRAIFGDKAGDVKDVSLKATPGLKGVVINTKIFSRKAIPSEKDAKQDEKKRQNQLTRLENEAISNLDSDYVARLAKLLDSQKILGLSLHNGTVIFRSGSKVTAEQVKKKFDEKQLKPEFILADSKVLSNAEKNELFVKMTKNYKQKRDEIIADFQAERNKIISGDELQPGILQMAKVYIAKKRKLQVGDKMAGRHGNKGIVSKIVPVEDMPFLPDGTSVDIVLNPLGVPSRMNLGQLYETALGWAGSLLGKHFATAIFDGAQWEDVSSYLEMAKLPENGKTILYDGHTGVPFDNLVTVGVIYMLKLSHLVEDKIHARSIGPYSLITQQPLGGKAQFGGQRLGEMEVWALEAYGAAFTLQEMITLKSDDVQGRAKMYEAIVKGDNMPVPSIPESFNVLERELQGLCLDLKKE